MKKNRFCVFALFVLLCLIVIICVGRRGSSFMISEMIPENITRIEVSGSQNGGELEPWELDQEEIEELTEWLSELSLKHRTYAEGKSPNIIWNGGASYEFNINDGELSFAWLYIDKAYIYYDDEWYVIVNKSEAPLNLRR